MDFPNRADLINWSNRELYKQTVTDYVFAYIDKSSVWAEIASEFPDLDEIIKEALGKRQTKQVRTEDLILEINVTGTHDDSLVNIQVSGGSEALRLRDILDKSEYIQREE